MGRISSLTLFAASLVALILLSSTTSSSNAFEPTDSAEGALYRERLIPAPVDALFGRGVVVFNEKLRCVAVLDEETTAAEDFQTKFDALVESVRRDFYVDATVERTTPAEYVDWVQQSSSTSQEASEFARRLVEEEGFFGRKNAYRVLATGDPNAPVAAEELIAARNESAGSLTIAASDFDALRDAFKTLRQLAETFPVADTVAESRYFIPETLIDDAPRLDFRGIHLCWFPETNPQRLESAIRIAAYYKFNYAVLEFWGVFPFDASDALWWDEFHTTKEEVVRLVKLGKELGITLIPQMNLWGHATASRVMNGKHVVLDFHPELEPLFEPDGWTWNIYNPATRDLLTKCVLELCDVFENPPYFHIGCDEAYSAGSSFMARRKGNYAAATAEWLRYFHDLLHERDCRMMMWHDMLVGSGEFKGYTASGNAVGILETLPKDVLICDWQYGAPSENETWPTSAYFREKGFETIACPWTNAAGIKSLGKNVADNDGFGLLCTTWHQFFSQNMKTILTVGASSGWGTTSPATGSANAQNVFNRHLRQASRETVGKEYRTGGAADWQVYEGSTTAY